MWIFPVADICVFVSIVYRYNNVIQVNNITSIFIIKLHKKLNKQQEEMIFLYSDANDLPLRLCTFIYSWNNFVRLFIYFIIWTFYYFSHLNIYLIVLYYTSVIGDLSNYEH